MPRRVTYTSRLGELADRLERGAPDAAKQTANHVAAEAHLRVPRDSERLDSTIRVVRTGEFTFEVQAGRKRRAFYGWLREFGAAHLPAQPFMVPAAEGQRGRLEERLKELIEP